jgi:hypothetical protein
MMLHAVTDKIQEEFYNYFFGDVDNYQDAPEATTF